MVISSKNHRKENSETSITHMHAHAHTHTHARTHMHARMHTRTHAHQPTEITDQKGGGDREFASSNRFYYF